MNRENIKMIVDSGSPMWEEMLIVELSTDPKVIPMMIELLGRERENKNELLRDSNAELSRALVTLMDEKYSTQKAIVDRYWVAGEIKKHYLKWKDFIRCNFKIDGLD